MSQMVVGLGLGLAVLIFLLFQAIRILPEYERGVVFRLGRLRPKDYGPGLFLLIPVVDRMVRVSLRTVVRRTNASTALPPPRRSSRRRSLSPPPPSNGRKYRGPRHG